ncbi:hypothetical protein CRN50_16735 [Vibrio vulnificus]|nr:hypothetical protein CRN30_14895 [Vibrio vulnificus]POB83236.1 hypothetical protein CRN35_02150 [Vibrio vulnificus]POB89785.1 hypothetical protein CRN53_17695 [Vibrio vulnificus]POC22662.1 hypothetical protein CRN42_09355 [Vibrio vulnificus]POC31635.1 hypothetical protein CRN50_16735 [Vibrio vulnificus]
MYGIFHSIVGFCISRIFGFLSTVFWVLLKRNPLRLKHNKAFKRDLARVAFLICVEFSVYGAMR